MISTSPITEHKSTSATGGGPHHHHHHHHHRTMTYDPYLGTSTTTGGGDSSSTRGDSKNHHPEFLIPPSPKPARYTTNNNCETSICTPLLATPYTTSSTPPVRINGSRPNVSTNQIITNQQQQKTRLPPPNSQQQQQIKYLPSRPGHDEAVNLVHKRGGVSEYNNGSIQPDEYSRLFVSNNTSNSIQFTSKTNSSQQYTPAVSHYYTQNSVATPIVAHQYASLYFNNSISQQQQQSIRPPSQFSLSTTTNSNTTNSILSPHQAYIHIPNNNNNNSTSYSPPKPGQSVLKDTIIKPQQQQQQQIKEPFKVPCGKEGSLKHRILTRPPGLGPIINSDNLNHNNNNIKSKRTSNNNNNGSLHPSGTHFVRGSLIQLASGELRKIEDMRTEDFISAAEKCPALRLDPSTVVAITENPHRPQEGVITLNYGRQGTQQVELEVSLEHPFFVYGKGWSSISPERSRQNFDLQCHRLHVGDICISLSPRPTSVPPAPPTTTPVVPPVSQGPSTVGKQLSSAASIAAHQATAAAAAAAAAAEILRKRRWSAPDQFCSDDENDGPTPSQRTKDTTTGF